MKLNQKNYSKLPDFFKQKMLPMKQKLSSKITGNDYFSAYRSRMQVNNDYFLDVSNELTAKGCKVYMPKGDRLIEFIRVDKGDKHIYFGFTDVPYRWYLNYDIDYRKGNGSGRTLKTEYDYDSPFTADQIIESMQPIAQQIGNSSYLVLFETNKPSDEDEAQKAFEKSHSELNP